MSPRMPRFETFTATLKEKKHLAADVLCLLFDAPLSFTFSAGQFVILKIMNKGETKNRSYSILNPPSERGKIALCAKIIEGGFASEAFKNMRIGSQCEMQGPFGWFTLDKKEERTKKEARTVRAEKSGRLGKSGKSGRLGIEYWLICTGAGITPIYSMLMEHVRNNPAQQFTLLFGCRTASDILFYSELKQLAQECPNFRYLITLSQEKWDGLRGRVQEHLPLDLNNKLFYVCGFRDMVLGTQQALMNKGVSPENIKVERYT